MTIQSNKYWIKKFKSTKLKTKNINTIPILQQNKFQNILKSINNGQNSLKKKTQQTRYQNTNLRTMRFFSYQIKPHHLDLYTNIQQKNWNFSKNTWQNNSKWELYKNQLHLQLHLCYLCQKRIKNFNCAWIIEN